MERLATTEGSMNNHPERSAPKYGGTVLELMAGEGRSVIAHKAGRNDPPPTPPIGMETSTRSGEGYAQVSDDSMTDHMYE